MEELEFPWYTATFHDDEILTILITTSNKLNDYNIVASLSN